MAITMYWIHLEHVNRHQNYSTECVAVPPEAPFKTIPGYLLQHNSDTIIEREIMLVNWKTEVLLSSIYCSFCQIASSLKCKVEDLKEVEV
jgi:hypothetical protein